MTGFWKHYFQNSNCNTSSCQPEPKSWPQGVHVRKYNSDSGKVEVVLLTGSDQADPTITDGGANWQADKDAWLNGLLKVHNDNNNIPQLTRADVIAVSFPEMTTGSIGNFAFTGCTSLTSVSFPKMIGYIGAYAFDRCSSLTSVCFPAMIGYIGDFAFTGCESLTSVSFPKMTKRIGNYAFRDCTSLTSVSFPAMTGNIFPGAFFGCSSLTSVSFPKMTENIGADAFEDCYRLGESDPGKTVIFAADQNFTNFYSWANVGTSGGRAAPQAVGNRIKFKNGDSGIPEGPKPLPP